MDGTKRNPPDIVTYRLNGKMVYVTPAANYEQALDFAQKVFHQQLSDIKRDRISFSVTVLTHGDRRQVRIAEMAWAAVVPTLQRYEIIDLHIQPEVHIIDSPDLHLTYFDEEEHDSKEAFDHFERESRSCPHSRAQSRKSSPSARPRSPRPRSLGSQEKKTWLEKHVHFL